MAVILHWPSRYLVSVARAYEISLFPSSDYLFLWENRSRISSYSRLYSTVIYGQLREVSIEELITRVAPSSFRSRLARMPLVLVVAIPGLVVYGLWRGLSSLGRDPADPSGPTALFLSFNAAGSSGSATSSNSGKTSASGFPSTLSSLSFWALS